MPSDPWAFIFLAIQVQKSIGRVHWSPKQRVPVAPQDGEVTAKKYSKFGMVNRSRRKLSMHIEDGLSMGYGIISVFIFEYQKCMSNISTFGPVVAFQLPRMYHGSHMDWKMGNLFPLGEFDPKYWKSDGNSASFLAHLVMSLCNHVLSSVCCWHRPHPCHLCTAVPVTGLIIELHISQIYASIPLVYAYEILCQCDIHFFKWQPF